MSLSRVRFLSLAMLTATGCDQRERPVSRPATAVTDASVGRPVVADAGGAPPTLGAAPPGAQRTASGLAFQVLRTGTGQKRPEPQDLVEVNYTGWSSDGTMFDSSVTRSASAQFQLDSAIKGWAEGISLMVAGEKRRFWVPAALAYGDKGGPRAPSGPLLFDIELLKVIDQPRPLPAPADVARPPANGKRTRSGAVYQTLVKGTGTRHPRRTDTVEVHYTTWTSEGKMLESTVVKGHPATFRTDALGKPWADALMTMVTGDKTRFWFPAALAGYLSPPKLVVYDVELRAIQ